MTVTHRMNPDTFAAILDLSTSYGGKKAKKKKKKVLIICEYITFNHLSFVGKEVEDTFYLSSILFK